MDSWIIDGRLYDAKYMPTHGESCRGTIATKNLLAAYYLLGCYIGFNGVNYTDAII